MDIISSLEDMSKDSKYYNYVSDPGSYSGAFEFTHYKDLPGGGRVSTKKKFRSEAAKDVTRFVRSHKPSWVYNLGTSPKSEKRGFHSSADWLAAYELKGDKVLVIRARFHPMHWEKDMQFKSYKVISRDALGTMFEKEADRASRKSREQRSSSVLLEEKASKLREKASKIRAKGKKHGKR